MSENKTTSDQKITLLGDEIKTFTLSLTNYDVTENPAHELQKNMLGQNEIVEGITKFSDLLYVAEAHHIYSGQQQGGASTESNQPEPDRFTFYTTADPRFFSNRPTNGVIWQTGSACPSAQSPTYNGHIINVDPPDQPGYLVFGPYFIMQPTASHFNFFNSYFYITDLDDVDPGQPLLRFEIGYVANGQWNNLVAPAILFRRQVNGMGDAMFTTMKAQAPGSDIIHGVEQRIWYYGVGYIEFYQNWCYRPRTQ